eukprot:TRINITY_DN24589_c0_g1_i1.p1 TRINITY_DN24589_c0_g1~~TRINITY_DN24589_c0_g1_i1.p1  ORF type:complete len:185 (-),score=32.68 TRINITY_DN24589_c0_g1_i1:159-713(-)
MCIRDRVSTQSTWELLSEFYPFDPYLLELSNAYIKTIYRSQPDIETISRDQISNDLREVSEQNQQELKQECSLQPNQLQVIPVWPTEKQQSIDKLNSELSQQDNNLQKSEYNCSTAYSDDSGSRTPYTPTSQLEDFKGYQQENSILISNSKIKRNSKQDLHFEESQTKKKIKTQQNDNYIYIND